MNLTQTIAIPQELSKHKDFPLRISQNNQKIYGQVEYVKQLVENMYEIYHKMSKSVIKLSDQNQRRLVKQNDSTALSIINFIKGIEKVFLNIKQQICNNTVNMNKKNQKVSKTRKDIIHQKLTKIYSLFVVYLEKVEKYNSNYKTYEQKCQYFKDIQKDVVKFYSTKENKTIFEELTKKQSEIQEQLQKTYSLKIELKSGLCEIRLSLKEFFEMLSNNAEDDKKLLLSLRKKLKEAKIFNETIIQEVNSQAEESVLQSSNDGRQHKRRLSLAGGGDQQYYSNQRNDRSLLQNEDSNNLNEQLGQTFSRTQQLFPLQTQNTFLSFTTKNIPIHKDIQQMIPNLHSEQYCISVFSQFIEGFQKEIIQNGQLIDKLRNSQQFQKFIDKKFQINQLLTSDMVYNIEAIKNEIADMRQIIEGIKGLFAKKKLINQLKKYRAMKCEKFLTQCEAFVHQERQSSDEKQTKEIRIKYQQQKQKFVKSHLQLMRRFRQIVQNMFRQINERFKFQRIPQMESKKIKNQFITKKYFSLLMLDFFVNKEEPPKFQMNPYLKGYQKHLSQENLKKIGLSSGDGQMDYQNGSKKSWSCCGFLSMNQKSQKNKYIDEFNCALMHDILIQGKIKIHPNYLKFVSSFNGKTLFGETNLRIPKWDIQSIEKRSRILSLVVVIKTARGELSFTSFLTDPYNKLLQIYENKQLLRKTKQQQSSSQSPNNRLSWPDYVLENNLSPGQYPTQKTHSETFTINNNNNNSLSPKNSNLNYMSQLQQKFQFQIPQMIDKQKVDFESLSTYLSDSKKELSISVQYHLRRNGKNVNNNKRYFFQIQLIDKNGKIEYKFVHQNSMEDEDIKYMLQTMATTIINKNTQPRTPKTPSNNKKGVQSQKASSQSKDLAQSKCSLLVEKCPIMKLFENSSCSFIQRRQNNQFEFQKDPSFVYVKQPSVAHLGGEPSFNYVPDLQIFKNMDSQRKQTFDDIKMRNKQNNRSFASSSKRSSKVRSRQISKQKIDSYLSSIDESTIKRNLFSQKNMNNKTLRRQDVIKRSKTQKQQSADKGSQGWFSVNMLVVVLIAILAMNVLVAISK